MEARRISRWAFDDLPNLLSLLVFFGATALIFRNIQFALIVTASLGFHELGHAAALAWYGLDWHITFGVVGAWTWSSLAERQRLSQRANALIHLGGPLFSLLLAIIALGLQVIWQPADRHLLTLASFSAQVGLFNLLPFGGLTDGGKIVRRMIASLDGARRRQIVLLPVFVTALMLAVYGLIQAPHLQSGESPHFLLELLLLGVWMVSSLMIESRRAARTSLEPAALVRPMTSGEVYFLTLATLVLLILGLIITAATPFWLAPEYVLGSLRNLVALLQFVHLL